MMDTSGIFILFGLAGLVIIIIVALIICLFVMRHYIIKKHYNGMSEFEVARYFQTKSGFPKICKYLYCYEAFILAILIIVLPFLYSYFNFFNYFDNSICLMIDFLLVISLIIINSVMRFKANKSLPIIWWFKGIAENDEYMIEYKKQKSIENSKTSDDSESSEDENKICARDIFLTILAYVFGITGLIILSVIYMIF